MVNYSKARWQMKEYGESYCNFVVTPDALWDTPSTKVFVVHKGRAMSEVKEENH